MGPNFWPVLYAHGNQTLSKLIFFCLMKIKIILLFYLKGWLTVFFLGLIVFMGCSLACVHACFF